MSKPQTDEMEPVDGVGGRTADESDVLFRRLVESVRDYAIFMLDTTGRVATWNIGAERIKGYRASEIIGRHFSSFYLEEEVKAGKCEWELEEAARVGRFEDEGWRVRKDGSRFWANVIISAMRDERGRLIGYSKVTRDLTERRRAEEDRAARLAAEQANQTKDEFLAVLGHELRNPLAPIVTALQLARMRGDGTLSREQQIIERQVNHMMHLVDDLLDISRVTRGKLELKRRTVDLRLVVGKSIEVAAPLLEQRAHHLDVDQPGVPLFVDGDEGRLVQIVTNLMTNAAKYTAAGGRIAVHSRRDGGHAVIAVRDNGAGIDPVLLPRVFDLFVQGYQSVERSTGGLGIGLALVRTLTELHGGTVGAASDGPGLGSTFTVRFPLSASLGLSAPQPLVVARPTSGRKILVVDDNADAGELLSDILRTMGHAVTTAVDAPTALIAARGFVPDIAILDIGLPVMDGYELAEHMVAERLGGPPLTLIALTGYGQPHDHARSQAAGFAAHLVKPVDIRQLAAAIDPEAKAAG